MVKRVILGLVLVLAVAPAGALPLGEPATDLVWMDPGSSSVITSDNVTYHGTIPIDSPGVGGEVVHRADLDKTFFFATGGKGLSIYDVTDPAQPTLVSLTPFPHFQNEDLKVSDDGTRAMIAADGALLLPVTPHATGIHLFDTTDVTNPVLIGSSSPLILGTGTDRGVAEHTAECANPDCSVIYGRTGRTYEFDEETGAISEIGNWNVDSAGNDVGGIHALNRDETGLVISDSNPRLILDPRQDPRNPTVLAQGTRSNRDNRLQHNNVRTDAADWVPRDPSNPDDDVQFVTVDRSGARAESITSDRPVMRAGELMLGNSESNLNTGCANAGGLSTWSIVNFDQGAQIQQLEVFKPLNGDWINGGAPPRNALGCSGHWFTESDGIVAASWYEHGVRFFEIDKTIGTIEEVGFFQPIATEAGAAHWIDDSFVYSVDYARGIDIVSFDREEEPPSEQQLVNSWLVNLGRVGSFAAAERYLCSLAAVD